MSAGFRRRSCHAVAAILTTAGLAACSGSSLPVMKASPKVIAAGRHYSFSAAHVPRSKWPNPCTLLTRSSGAAALDTTVSVHRFHTSCFYTPGSNAVPTLIITLLAVGTASDSSYRQVAGDNKGQDGKSVRNVGRSAYLHSVRHLPATRLNVLSRYAHFSVTEQSPVGQKLAPARADALLVTVGRVVAKSFGG